MQQRRFFALLIRTSSWALSFVCAVTAAAALLAVEDAATSRDRLLKDIQFLASDELEGRGIGTQGLDLAADFIRDEFQKAGLKPAMPNGSYFQPFEMISGRRLSEGNSLMLRGPSGNTVELAVGKDFAPFAQSSLGEFDGPLVFVGYGITAAEFSYDDYADTDVKGKVVLIMLHEPGPWDKADPHSPFSGNVDTKHARFDEKALNAAKHGAKAVLFVSAPHILKGQADKLLELESVRGSQQAKVAQIQVTSTAIEPLLKAGLGKDLAAVEKEIESDLKPRSKLLEGWSVTGRVAIEDVRANVKNVLGMLEAGGPHAQETIVLGAHYDHWGRGGEGSLAPGSREIHNGADDNASGTAGVLELARRLARRDPGAPGLGRRIVFAAFTAEERGLFGSAHYVEDPVIALTHTVAMINFDMIGRLRDDKLIVYGTGTASEFMPLLEKLNADRRFSIRPIATGMGPSDQTSFYAKKIPVLHFFTDNHPDYHKPSDDWEKISIEGAERVVDMVEDLIVELANAESRPTFVLVPEAPKADGPGGERAWLGSIPAFGEQVDGTLLSGVTPDSPADRAGLRGGDLIVQLGTHEIHGLQDLRDALTRHKPGEIIKVVVQRGPLKISYPVTLGRRQQ